MILIVDDSPENIISLQKVLEKNSFEVDSAAAGNMINDLKFVEGIIVWCFFSEDSKAKVIKANIRSRGPVINEVAAKYGGGGHAYASGARLKTWEEVGNVIKDLDEVTKKYLSK